MQAFASMVGFCVITYLIYRSAAERAAESARARTRLIRGSIASIVSGAAIGIWGTTHVPETPGSPGTLVMLALIWIVGGGLIYTGIVSLPAAIRARPGDLPDFQ